MFDFLVDSSNVLTLTSDFRIPYTQHRTLSVAEWGSVAGQDAIIVGGRIIEHIEQVLREVYASRVNVIAHSAGGLAARLVIAVGAPVRKLIMVGTPNNGTTQVYLATSGCSRADVDHLLLNTFGGILFPRMDNSLFMSRGPYSAQDVCLPLSPPPIAFIFDLGLPPDDVEVFNIYTKHSLGGETPWDVTAKASKDWFIFKERPLKKAEKCSPKNWLALRNGDGFIAVEDARLGIGDIEIVSETSHVFQLDDPAVRLEIARALGLVP